MLSFAVTNKIHKLMDKGTTLEDVKRADEDLRANLEKKLKRKLTDDEWDSEEIHKEFLRALWGMMTAYRSEEVKNDS